MLDDAEEVILLLEDKSEKVSGGNYNVVSSFLYLPAPPVGLPEPSHPFLGAFRAIKYGGAICLQGALFGVVAVIFGLYLLVSQHAVKDWRPERSFDGRISTE